MLKTKVILIGKLILLQKPVVRFIAEKFNLTKFLSEKYCTLTIHCFAAVTKVHNKRQLNFESS